MLHNKHARQEKEMLEELSAEGIVEDKESSIMKEVDRVKNRERGLKANNKPLIWRREIEEYPDEQYPIREKGVVSLFNERIHRPNLYRPFKFDQYYLKERKERRKRNKVIIEKDIKYAANLLQMTYLSQIRKRLRNIIKKENKEAHAARNLHLDLKQTGYKTEGSLLFSIIAKRSFIQKERIAHKMEKILNRLTSIQERVKPYTEYAQKCIDLFAQRIITEGNDTVDSNETL